MVARPRKSVAQRRVEIQRKYAVLLDRSGTDFEHLNLAAALGNKEAAEVLHTALAFNRMRKNAQFEEQHRKINRASKIIKSDPVFSKSNRQILSENLADKDVQRYLVALERFLNNQMTESEYSKWAKKFGVKLSQQKTAQ